MTLTMFDIDDHGTVIGEPASARRPLPFACSRCDERWSGQATCHCSGCHLTYSSISAFDAHRRNGTCRAPDASGLVALEKAYPVFGYPTDPKRRSYFDGLRMSATQTVA
ncbi:FDXHR family putative zinc-binding protein [Rhodococcoides kyotonense]|uniref:Phage FDXHR zinc binding domain-containing protein n=1 Tax=Rhodococcoides kyotonense TaxID=398843 RepID=A0A239FDM6_9NOCA|nr:hypothetical protein [Rhodococcus kyotonensis]SNS54937.1 hypothetical protein SAMN05421642_103242 [Rhodococcus kyotonensis]